MDICEKRVAKNINSWGSKYFMEGGREILIESVIQAVPSYAMSCCQLPGSICEDIERICCDFLWGLKKDDKKMHLCSWDELRKPIREGGLDFRKLIHSNKALLAKQLWRIIADPLSLIAQLFKARYFKNIGALDAEAGLGSSRTFGDHCARAKI